MDYFLSKNVAMKGDYYIEVLKEHLLVFYDIHAFDFLMHDGALAHRSKSVEKFLTDNNIEALDWPGDSPELNPIEMPGT